MAERGDHPGTNRQNNRGSRGWQRIKKRRWTGASALIRAIRG